MPCIDCLLVAYGHGTHESSLGDLGPQAVAPCKGCVLFGKVWTKTIAIILRKYSKTIIQYSKYMANIYIYIYIDREREIYI